MHDDLLLVRSPFFHEHRSSTTHPENPKRLGAIDEIFREFRFQQLPTLEVSKIDESLLNEIHSNGLLSLAGSSGWLDADTYYSSKSLDVALTAAGSTVELALKIWKGEYRRGFSLVRPPGHHATRDRAMGFCLFNNVALAAHAVLKDAPSARLAIVDFDLHHGNGTQSLFYDNPNVLFISSHRYPFYPGTGAIEQIGSGKGRGTKINFPLPQAYGDEVFIPLYSEIIGKILKEFRPAMILVSAGYDGHSSDPMGGFNLSSEAYGVLSEILVGAAELNEGKILFCLEGGYNPEALKESVRHTLDKMLVLPRRPFNVALPKTALISDNSLEDFRKYHGQFFPQL